MTTTRHQRSPLGAFYRSPLGAFGSGEAEEEYSCLECRFEVNEQLGSQPIGWDTSVGDALDTDSTREDLGQPLDYRGFRFNAGYLGIPVEGTFPPYEQLKDWYFLGETSGAIWRPIDWGVFVFHSYEWEGIAPGFRGDRRKYVAAPPESIVGAVEYYSEWHSINEAITFRSFFDVQTNPGFGNARDLRDLGFQHLESVFVCDSLAFASYQCTAAQTEDTGPRLLANCQLVTGQGPAMQLVLIAQSGADTLPESAAAFSIQFEGQTSGAIYTWDGPGECDPGGSSPRNYIGANGGYAELSFSSGEITQLALRDADLPFQVGEPVTATLL